MSLEPLLRFLPGWLMVLVRITGIFFAAPVFSNQALPTRIRALWALGMSFCVYPMLYPMLMGPGPSGEFLQRLGGAAGGTPGGGAGLSLPGLAVAVALELGVGLVIGYGATLPLVGMQMAGQVVDQQIGLGLASIFNPDLQEETSVVGQLHYIMALMIFVALGGHRLVLGVLLGSFHGVPLGGFRFDGRLLELMVGLMTSMFELALRVSAPLLCLIFLETVAMGFIARTVPQMNILSFGFPLRIMIGVGVLALGTSAQAGVFVESMRHTLNGLSRFFSTA